MRHFYKHVLIFSVYRTENTQDTNCDLHANIKGALEQYQIPFRELVGRYENTYEISLMVDASARKFVEEACLKTRQECYLDRTADGAAYLKYQDGRIEHIGQFVEVSKAEAKESQCYTFDPETQKYFMAK